MISSGVKEYGDAFALVEANDKFANSVKSVIRKLIENGVISYDYLEENKELITRKRWYFEHNLMVELALNSRGILSTDVPNRYEVDGKMVYIYATPLDTTILSHDTEPFFTIIDNTGEKEGIKGVDGVLTHLNLLI